MRNLISTIQDIVHQQQVALGDRPAAMALLVAEAVGNTLAIPTSAVDNPNAYFRNTHQQNLNSILSEINEVSVIDIDEVESVIYKLWLARYMLVFQADSPRVQQLMKLLLNDGSNDLPQRYSELSCKYQGLYANRHVMASANEAKPEGQNGL